MNKFELLEKYVYGGYEDGITNYKILKEFLGIELDKIPFTEIQFSSYRKCYEKLKEIFFDNALIGNYCRNVLNYDKENHTLNQEWDFEARRKYHYRNSIPTQEIRVICKDRKYFLSYRKLDLKKLLEESPTSQTSPKGDFSNEKEHNISLKDNSNELSQISSNDETSLNNNIQGINPKFPRSFVGKEQLK